MKNEIKKKYDDFGKVVKLNKDGIFIATYNSCYTAASKNDSKPRRIYKCCIGEKSSTSGFKFMLQEEYLTKRRRVKISYYQVA